jgi:hypothetical protein
MHNIEKSSPSWQALCAAFGSFFTRAKNIFSFCQQLFTPI